MKSKTNFFKYTEFRNTVHTQMKSDDVILVTGGTGYIAGWVIHYALQTGCRVRTTVRDVKNESKLKHLKDLPGAKERLEFVNLDLVKSTPEDYAKAVDGVTYILHTASPFPSKAPKHEDELIKPAVEGTVGILRAALNVPSVQRVVVTSSVAAVGEDPVKVLGEKDWNDLATAAYYKSKTKAEHAAWKIVEENKPSWSLCTINPAFVLGPMLGNDPTGTSTEVMLRVLKGQLVVYPDLGFCIVDVRDVARGHIQALELPIEDINKRRFLLCNETHGIGEYTKYLKPRFGNWYGYFPTIKAPVFLLHAISFFDPSIKMVLSNVGIFPKYDNSPSREVLKIQYHDFKKTLEDMADACVYHGFVKRAHGYTPPNPDWTPLTS